MGQGRSLGVAVMNDFGFGGRGLAMFFFCERVQCAWTVAV